MEETATADTILKTEKGQTDIETMGSPFFPLIPNTHSHRTGSPQLSVPILCETRSQLFVVVSERQALASAVFVVLRGLAELLLFFSFALHLTFISLLVFSSLQASRRS